MINSLILFYLNHQNHIIIKILVQKKKWPPAREQVHQVYQNKANKAVKVTFTSKNIRNPRKNKEKISKHAHNLSKILNIIGIKSSKSNIFSFWRNMKTYLILPGKKEEFLKSMFRWADTSAAEILTSAAATIKKWWTNISQCIWFFKHTWINFNKDIKKRKHCKS